MTKTKNNRPPVVINRNWCKNCAICLEFCPREVFGYSEEGLVEAARPERCTLCGMCQLRCPDFAISLEDNKDD